MTRAKHGRECQDLRMQKSSNMRLIIKEKWRRLSPSTKMRAKWPNELILTAWPKKTEVILTETEQNKLSSVRTWGGFYPAQWGWLEGRLAGGNGRWWCSRAEASPFFLPRLLSFLAFFPATLTVLVLFALGLAPYPPISFLLLFVLSLSLYPSPPSLFCFPFLCLRRRPPCPCKFSLSLSLWGQKRVIKLLRIFTNYIYRCENW